MLNKRASRIGIVCALLASGCLVLVIRSLVSVSDVERLSPGGTIYVTRPGQYTLFVSSTNPAPGNEFEMTQKIGRNSVRSDPTWGSQELRTGGRKYFSARNFNISSPGEYYVLSSGRTFSGVGILKPCMPAGLILFLLGFLQSGTVLLAVGLRWVLFRRNGKINK